MQNSVAKTKKKDSVVASTSSIIQFMNYSLLQSY